MKTPRILSGMRPTGKLHLGHLVGALENWVRLQNEYECFYCVVDWHALTTHYDDTSRIREYIVDNAIDWLAAGLDPQRSTLFIQSHVMEHAELHLLFSMIVPLPWLERVPTYKEQMSEIKDHDLNTYGFLGYPLLQSADILIYKANAVPVGADQVAHIELTREIARRFNHFYDEVFPEPQTLLTEVPKLPGTDGRKMSKSYGNTIEIFGEEKATRKKIMSLVMDSRTPQEPKPDADKNIAIQLLKLVAPAACHGATDYGAAMEWARDVLAKSPPGPRLPRRVRRRRRRRAAAHPRRSRSPVRRRCGTRAPSRPTRI